MRRTFRALCAFLCLAGLGAHGAPAVSAGDQHSLAVHADGSLRAWGDDSGGALGTGRSLVQLVPAPVSRLENGVAIAAGRSHTLALTRDGRAWAWGYNGEGQLGDGSRTGRSIPTPVAGLDGVTDVGAGIVHSVALRSDGTVWTWGASYTGQLGEDVPEVIRDIPGRVPGLSNVTAIAAGREHTVALTGDGRVWAWGLNQSGQLGDGTIAPQGGYREAPRVVAGLDDVVAIAAGAEHTLALRRDGTVWAWGHNSEGSLGDGTTVTRGTPAIVPGLTGVARIAAGSHSAAVRNDGSVWAWGPNSYGQVGDGSNTERQLAPVRLSLNGVAAISIGLFHSAAARSDGNVYAWGDNDHGQLGDGTRTRHDTPTLLPGVSDVIRLAAGETHTVALTGAGRVLAWGDNSSGQLGDGVRIFRTTPAIPSVAATFTEVSAGGRYSLALATDGRVWASGNNEFGQLGDGTRASRATFAPVSLLAGVTQIAAGFYHGLALKADGTVWAWGPEYMGRLGTGEDFTYPEVPVQVRGLTDVTRIAAGFGHSLALRRDGTVWAWGENFAGQVGDGTVTERYLAVQVPGLAGVAEIAAGFDHSLARSADGSVWAWGGNYAGQIGDGTQLDRLSPVRVALPARATQIAAGVGSAALTSDGGVWRWGANYDGQLGVGDIDDHVVPVRLAAFGGVRALAVGGAHTLALRTDGTVFSWGRSDFGQLGDGTLASRHTPVAVARENGAGSVADNDWFLDLDPATPNAIPPEKVPSFLVVTSSTASTVTADIRYRAQDIGSTASTFVFALAPATGVQGAAAAGDERVQWKARGGMAKSSHVQCALAQLNAQGQLVAVSAASMQAYVSGVLSAQGQSVNVLNATNPNLAGATFYVGYGPNGNAMLVNGTTRSVVSVPGTVSCQPQPPQTGWWYNPAEGGRGFSIEARGSRLFMAAFHYDAAGRATWNFAGGATSLDGSLFTSEFLGASGGQSLTGPYRLPGLSVAGPITLAFSDDTHGTLFWPGGSVAIERQPFVPNGLTAEPQANQPESGWWWNPAESGRGFFIEWQNGYADLAGYMYDEAGNPTWYISVFPTPNPMVFNGNWWSFAGGQSMGGPYRPATRTSDNVGTVAIEFASPTTATMTLPDGRRIPLVRQGF